MNEQSSQQSSGADPVWVSATVAPAANNGGGSRTVGLQLGVAAVIIAATFGIGFTLVSALSGGNNTGSNTPEDAVRDLAASVEAEDVLGMLATMAPSEVGTMAKLYDPLVELGRQQGMLETAGSPFDGVDLAADLRVVRTVRLHDDVAKVYLEDGTLSASVDPQSMSITDVYDLEPVDEAIEITDAVREIDQAVAGEYIEELDRQLAPPSGLYLMTVKQGGQWYVSYQYTVAEYIREVLALPEANFDISRNAEFEGAESPEGVLDIVAATVDDFGPEDIEAALDSAEQLADNFDFDLTAQGGSLLVPPDEIGPFLDYAPSLEAMVEELFTRSLAENDVQSFDQALDEARQALEEIEYDFDFDLDFETTRVEDAGDRVVLRIDRARLDARVQFEFEGDRVDAEITVELLPGLCGRVSARADVNGELDSFEESACADDVLPGTDFDGIVVVMVERDGQWYMSMLETGIEYASLALQSELDN